MVLRLLGRPKEADQQDAEGGVDVLCAECDDMDLGCVRKVLR